MRFKFLRIHREAITWYNLCNWRCKRHRATCAGVPIEHCLGPTCYPWHLSKRGKYSKLCNAWTPYRVKTKEQNRDCHILLPTLHHALRSLPIALPCIPTPTPDAPGFMFRNTCVNALSVQHGRLSLLSGQTSALTCTVPTLPVVRFPLAGWYRACTKLMPKLTMRFPLTREQDPAHRCVEGERHAE